MRGQVLAAVARTRQLPPEIRTHARPRGSASSARGTTPWLPWLSGLAAAAAIAVAVFFGFANSHTQQQLNAARAQNQALAAAQAKVQAELGQARAHDQVLAEILGAPHVTLLSRATTKGGVAVVVLDAATRQLVVATSGLPALPAGQVYQLWLINPAKIVSAGLLPDRPERGDLAGHRHRPGPGRRARPDRRARPRHQAAHHHADPRPAPAGVRSRPQPAAPPVAGGLYAERPAALPPQRLARPRPPPWHERNPPWPRARPGRVGPALGRVSQAGQLQLVTWPPAITTVPATSRSPAQMVYCPAGRPG